VEMERKRIYCFRWSSVSESDNVIEVLILDGMGKFGSPKLPKLVTGRCRFLYRSLGLESRFHLLSAKHALYRILMISD